MVSRRAFIHTSAAAVVGGFAARADWTLAFQQPAPAAQTPPQITPVFTELRRNVGLFTGRGGTIGYLVDEKGVAVVDSQYRDAAKLFLDGLNTRSKSRPVDRLINTHHHGDHTDGNVVFKGVAKKVVAHAKAAEDMHAPPGQQPPTTEQLYPDATFTDTWREQVGDEWIRAKYYGKAHTSGDAVITFERANVAHMGDLMFHQRHPIVDGAAGASLKNWITVLERTVKDHKSDTIFIFGHAGPNLPVSGNSADLLRLRDYMTALLDFVSRQMKAGKSRDEILAMRDPLAGFEVFGRFPNANPRDPLTNACNELSGASR
jgi:glyoxylase-like metal-dependent hydrolase (beta-lactamase superfamily II)